jgi:hypothetical protein
MRKPFQANYPTYFTDGVCTMQHLNTPVYLQLISLSPRVRVNFLKYVRSRARLRQRNTTAYYTRNQDSEWLQAGRTECPSSSPGRVNNSLFSKSCRPALGSTQYPIQWVLGASLHRVKWPRREDNRSSPTRAEVKKRHVYIYIYIYIYITLPIRLHGVLLN